MGRAKGGRRLLSPSLSLLRTSSQRRVSHPRSPTHAPTHPASFIDTKASHRAIGSTHLPSHSQTRHSSSVRTQSYNTESEDGSIRRLTINRTDTYTYLFRKVFSHSLISTSLYKNELNRQHTGSISGTQE
jgi:hypothetical protein